MIDSIKHTTLQLLSEEQKCYARALTHSASVAKGFLASGRFKLRKNSKASAQGEQAYGPLRAYFEEHKAGRGLVKWEHYFEIYEKHLHQFVGRSPRMMEIGIYAGGSLDMWKHYFGQGTRIFGVDILPETRKFEDETTKIFIGDQEDRSFWQSVKNDLGSLDIVIDDGGHTPEQQRVTFEELFPLLKPGGVYICEDVHETFNRFADYVHGIVHQLNDFNLEVFEDNNGIKSQANESQSAIESISFYPFVIVIQKSKNSINMFKCPKHGTVWNSSAV